MAAWIKMSLGTEVGLGPSDFVLYGDPAPPPRKGCGAPPPIFRPCLLWPNGWMDQDGTWHGCGPRSRPYCARWGPCYLPKKGEEPPSFRPISVVAKRLDASRCHLVMEVGLSPGDFVLDGDPAPPKSCTAPASFWSMSIVAK